MADAEEDSASEGSSTEELGVATQVGLTGALAQIANAAFLAGAPGELGSLDQDAWDISTHPNPTRGYAATWLLGCAATWLPGNVGTRLLGYAALRLRGPNPNSEPNPGEGGYVPRNLD